jgi:hypothetical protein
MSLIYANLESSIVRDYYEFIVGKISNLSNIDDYAIQGWETFDTKEKKVIFINYEHNLVSPVEYYYANLIGKIPMINNPMHNYLVRIDRLDKLVQSEYYIEYSKPNIENIKSCDQLNQFLDKIIYIPPLLCDYSPNSDSRSDYDIITSFYILNPQGRPRRKVLHDSLSSQFEKYFNIPGAFGDELYNKYYKRSKILINVHQTDNHHTFEELRVLPALLNGLVVVAENSPLKDSIPYSEYIIWCDYDDIVHKTKEVLDNYESYYQKIHGEFSELKNIILKMDSELVNELESKIK